MKRPRTKKKTEVQHENKPKEEIYMLSIWCRGQDCSFDCNKGTLGEMIKIKKLLMQSKDKRIELDNRTFRTQGIDVIKIRQIDE